MLKGEKAMTLFNYSYRSINHVTPTCGDNFNIVKNPS